MMKVSELLGKPIISLYGAISLGSAADIIFDSKLKKAKFIKVYSVDDETFYINICNIKSLATDALAIANSNKLLHKNEFSFDNGTNNPINSSVYSVDGKLIGTVKDIILNKTTVETILTDDKELTANNIVAISDGIIVYNDTNRPFRATAPRKTNSKLEIDNCSDVALPKLVRIKQPFISNPNLSTLYGFLLGKINS